MPYQVLEYLLAFAFLLLCTQGGLLLALGLFEAGHETGISFGFLGVGHQFGTHLLFIDKLAGRPGLYDGDEQRQEVVVAQARRVVVEEEQEHHRHHIHHPLHAGHAVAAGLIGHVDFGVDYVHHCHKQTEQAHVVAVEGYAERKSEYRVGGRQVLGPEE